jgi:hypothetical protein
MDGRHLSGGLKTTKGHGLIAQATDTHLESPDADWNISKLAPVRHMLRCSGHAAHVIKAAAR